MGTTDTDEIQNILTQNIKKSPRTFIIKLH